MDFFLVLKIKSGSITAITFIHNYIKKKITSLVKIQHESKMSIGWLKIKRKSYCIVGFKIL